MVPAWQGRSGSQLEPGCWPDGEGPPGIARRPGSKDLLRQRPPHLISQALDRAVGTRRAE